MGAALGLLIAILFLVLSLKIADPALEYNPYRWLSKPHEWAMLAGLIVQANILVYAFKMQPNLQQFFVMFCLAHLGGAAFVYGLLVLLGREVVVRVRRFTASRQESRP